MLLASTLYLYLQIIFPSIRLPLPAGWALSCCNKPEETQIFVHVAHINPHAQNLFLDTCQLWLHLIRYGCFLIVRVVQRMDDLNKSAIGTKVPPLHLLIAIVSPWKVFQNTTVVFSRRGKMCGWLPWQLGYRRDCWSRCLWNVLYKQTSKPWKQMKCTGRQTMKQMSVSPFLLVLF